VSLNPIRHIDPVGTVALPLILLAVSKLVGGGFIFGWAKPVPVNFGNLRNPKRDMLWVAAAGPGANLVMALFWALLFKVASLDILGEFTLPLGLMAAAGIHTNAIFMALNLLPIPPLDGGRIVVSLLPHRQAYRFARIEPYGFIIILALMFTHVLEHILFPLLNAAIILFALPFNVSPAVIVSIINSISR
jgi:Zn-dependent protease